MSPLWFSKRRALIFFSWGFLEGLNAVFVDLSCNVPAVGHTVNSVSSVTSLIKANHIDWASFQGIFWGGVGVRSHSPCVSHHAPTGLYLNFLGSPLSLATPMSSSRNGGKVYSTSSKSEWTCWLGTGRRVEAGPQEGARQMQTALLMWPYLCPAFLCPSISSAA